MPFPLLITLPPLGPIGSDFEEIARTVVESTGLRFVQAKVDHHTKAVTVTAHGNTEAQVRSVDAQQLQKRLQQALFPPIQPATNSTHIGTVIGPVHTGSGNLTVEITIDVLLQKLESALTAAGADSNLKKSVMSKIMAVVQDIGTEFGAKLAAELVKPG